eukprot:EG_transcript_19468
MSLSALGNANQFPGLTEDDAFSQSNALAGSFGTPAQGFRNTGQLQSSAPLVLPQSHSQQLLRQTLQNQGPPPDAKDQMGRPDLPLGWDFNSPLVDQGFPLDRGPAISSALSLLAATISGTSSSDSLNRRTLPSAGLDLGGPSLDQLTAQLLKDPFR